MSRRSTIAFMPVALVLGLGAAACGGGPAGPSPITSPSPRPTPTPAPAVTAVRVEGAATVTEGETLQLKAMAELSAGSPRDVTAEASWLSSNPAIATVSATGLVTGVRAGTADISAGYQSLTGRRTVSIGVASWDLRIALSSVTALETCDDFTQGLNHMEVAYRASVVRPDGRQSVLTDTGYPGNPSGSRLSGAVSLRTGQVVRLSGEETLTLPGAAGQFARVEFRATEWDEQIVVFPPSVRWVRDDSMDGRLGTRSHTYGNGAWSNLGNNSLTLGSSGCRLRLDYEVTASRR
jgi:hypothetical protein